MEAPREAEAIATAALVAIIGGLLLPKALFVSLDRGILVWIVTCVSCGVIASSLATLTIRFSIVSAASASFIMSASIIGFMIVRWIVTRLQTANEMVVFIPLGSGAIYNPLEPMALLFTSALLLISFIASFALICVSTLASRPLVSAAVRVFRFGPEGVTQVGRILTAIVSVVAATVALWGAFE